MISHPTPPRRHLRIKIAFALFSTGIILGLANHHLILPATPRLILGTTKVLLNSLAIVLVSSAILSQVIHNVRSLTDLKYGSFTRNIAEFMTSILRTTLTAPAAFLYWLAGADYKTVKSQWILKDTAKPIGNSEAHLRLHAFWRSDLQYVIVGVFIALVGVYIFAATAYFLTLLTGTSAHDVSSDAANIPVFGPYLKAMLSGVSYTTAFISLLVSVWAMWIDRAIYADKSVERYLWSRNNTRDVNHDKNSFVWALTLLFLLRLGIAWGFSYFGAQAAELFFFQKDIDRAIATKTIQQTKDTIRDSSSASRLRSEIAGLDAQIAVLRQAINFEDVSPNKNKAISIGWCIIDGIGRVSIGTNLSEKNNCSHIITTTGSDGKGSRYNNRIKELNDLEARRSTALSSLDSEMIQKGVEAKTVSGQDAYGHRLAVLSQLESSGAVSSAHIRLLVLLMEMMPAILKMTSVLFLFYQSPLNRYLFAIEDEFCRTLENNGVCLTCLEDQKESKERLLEKGISILENHVPVVLYWAFPIAIFWLAVQHLSPSQSHWATSLYQFLFFY